MQRLLRFQENTFLLFCMPESKHGAVNLSDTKNVPFLSVRQSRSQIFAFLETLMTDYHFLFHSRSPSREWNDLIITNVSWCLHAPSWGRESWESQEGCSGTQTAGFSQPSWLLWWDYLTTRVVFGWPSQNFMSSFFNVKEDVYILALKYLFSLAQRGCYVDAVIKTTVLITSFTTSSVFNVEITARQSVDVRGLQGHMPLWQGY